MLSWAFYGFSDTQTKFNMQFEEAIMDNSFGKFKELCAIHEAFGNPVSDAQVSNEDTIIRNIKKEGLRLIRQETEFDSLLRDKNNFVQFWSVMCCLDYDYKFDDARLRLTYLMQPAIEFSISSRATLAKMMIDNGGLPENR